MRDPCEGSDPLFLQIVDYRRHRIASTEIVILRRPFSIQKRQTDEWTAGQTDRLIYRYMDTRTDGWMDERIIELVNIIA